MVDSFLASSQEHNVKRNGDGDTSSQTPPWAVALLFMFMPVLGFLIGYITEHLAICRINRLLRKYGARGGTGFGRGFFCGWDSLLKPLHNMLICCAVAIFVLNAFVLRLHCWIKPTSIANVVDCILVLIYGNPKSLESSPEGCTPAIVMCAIFLCKLLCLSIGISVGAAFQPVGLTGGIACGKTTVSSLLSKDPRFIIIDVDQISHDIMDSTMTEKLGRSSAYHNVVKAFGKDILQHGTTNPSSNDNENKSTTLPQIDRQKLGDIIFKDRNKRRLLNKLTHPRIISIMLRKIAWYHIAAHRKKIVVVDIPLLFEAGKIMQYLFGYILVVAVKPKTQVKRLMERNPELTKEQCQERISSQFPIQTKVEKADAVLWNDGPLSDTENSLDNIKLDIISTYQNWGRVTFGGVVLWIWLQAVMMLSIEYWSRI